MIKKKFLKIMAISLMVLAATTFNSVQADAEWKSDAKGKWYSDNSSVLGWSIGWKSINGKWYYFDSKTGYMKYNEIVDGYYVNGDGVYISNPSEEIKQYEKIIRSNDWYDKITNGMKWCSSLEGSNSYSEINAPLRGIIIDLNNDGVNEMIVTNDSQFSLRVVTYVDGNIKVLPPKDELTYPQYFGYNKATNELLTYSYELGTNDIAGYKITTDNRLERTFRCLDCVNNYYGISENYKGYYISWDDYCKNKKVSRQEYINKLIELRDNANDEGKQNLSEMIDCYNKNIKYQKEVDRP